MLLSRRDFRAMVYYEYARGSPVETTRDSLFKTFGKDAPSRETIENCYLKFAKTKSYLDGLETPCTRVVTTEYVDGVRRIIRENPCVFLSEIAEILNISLTAAHKILDEHLCFTQKWGNWVPKNLSSKHIEARMHWCRLMIRRFDNGCSSDIEKICTGSEIWVYRYQDENESYWTFDQHEKCVLIEKRAIACVFSKFGFIGTITLDTNRNKLTVPWLTKTFIPRLLAEWRAGSAEKKELYIHHEKTQPHTAAKTISFIHEQKARLLPHPPHSPDLAPAHYYLFPMVRDGLKNQRFRNFDDASAAQRKFLEDQEVVSWEREFDFWFQRIRKCQRSGANFLDET